MEKKQMTIELAKKQYASKQNKERGLPARKSLFF
jgi:hypothetical protein